MGSAVGIRRGSGTKPDGKGGNKYRIDAASTVASPSRSSRPIVDSLDGGDQIHQYAGKESEAQYGQHFEGNSGYGVHNYGSEAPGAFDMSSSSWGWSQAGVHQVGKDLKGMGTVGAGYPLAASDAPADNVFAQRSVAGIPPGPKVVATTVVSNAFVAGERVQLHGLPMGSRLNGRAGIVHDFDTESGRWLVDVEDVGILKIREQNMQGKDGAKASSASSVTVSSTVAPAQAPASSPSAAGADDGALREGSVVELMGLTDPREQSLNGQRGVLLRFDATSRRWHVEVEGFVLKLPLNNLSRPSSRRADVAAPVVPDAVPRERGGGFKEGASVEICGLVASSFLNGRHGRLRSFDPKAKRWVVEFNDRSASGAVEVKAFRPANLRVYDTLVAASGAGSAGGVQRASDAQAASSSVGDAGEAKLADANKGPGLSEEKRRRLLELQASLDSVLASGAKGRSDASFVAPARREFVSSEVAADASTAAVSPSGPLAAVAARLRRSIPPGQHSSPGAPASTSADALEAPLGERPRGEREEPFVLLEPQRRRGRESLENADMPALGPARLLLLRAWHAALRSPCHDSLYAFLGPGKPLRRVPGRPRWARIEAYLDPEGRGEAPRSVHHVGLVKSVVAFGVAVQYVASVLKHEYKVALLAWRCAIRPPGGDLKSVQANEAIAWTPSSRRWFRVVQLAAFCDNATTWPERSDSNAAAADYDGRWFE